MFTSYRNYQRKIYKSLTIVLNILENCRFWFLVEINIFLKNVLLQNCDHWIYSTTLNIFAKRERTCIFKLNCSHYQLQFRLKYEKYVENLLTEISFLSKINSFSLMLVKKKFNYHFHHAFQIFFMKTIFYFNNSWISLYNFYKIFKF